jgi:hypothetical protein
MTLSGHFDLWRQHLVLIYKPLFHASLSWIHFFNLNFELRNLNLIENGNYIYFIIFIKLIIYKIFNNFIIQLKFFIYKLLNF